VGKGMTLALAKALGKQGAALGAAGAGGGYGVRKIMRKRHGKRTQ